MHIVIHTCGSAHAWLPWFAQLLNSHFIVVRRKWTHIWIKLPSWEYRFKKIRKWTLGEQFCGLCWIHCGHTLCFLLSKLMLNYQGIYNLIYSSCLFFSDKPLQARNRYYRQGTATVLYMYCMYRPETSTYRQGTATTCREEQLLQAGNNSYYKQGTATAGRKQLL